MEIIINIIDFLILGIIIVSPILIFYILKKLKVKRTLIPFTIFSILTLALLIWIFTWWDYRSKMILLNHYGYNFDGLGYAEIFKNVDQKNIEKVKGLETSIMGIGWPVKAIFGFFILSPYFVFVYIVKILIDKIRIKKTRPNNRYKPLLAEGLRRLVLLVTLCYLDYKAP